jgi:hypothetical protein
MKFAYLLMSFAMAVPVAIEPTSAAAVPSQVPSPQTSDPITNLFIQPVQNHVQNENKEMAIAGNAANRDQVNTVTSQENKARKQTIIGSQSDSHDVNVVNSNSTTTNQSNTTVTNTDKSVHTTNHLAVANDFSQKTDKTVNNHFQEVQNVYRIEQRVEASKPASYQLAPVKHAASADVIPLATREQTNSLDRPIESTSNKVTLEMVRAMIKNAKATSDMAYDMALQLAQ